MSDSTQKSIIVAREKESGLIISAVKKVNKDSFLTFGKARGLGEVPLEYNLFPSVEKAMVFENKDDAIVKLYNAKNQWEEHKQIWEKKISDANERDVKKTRESSQRISFSKLFVTYSQGDTIRRNHIELNYLNLDKFELSVEPFNEHFREVFLGLTFEHYLFMKKTASLDSISLCNHVYLPKQGLSLNPGYKDFDSLEKAMAYVNEWVSDIISDLSAFYDVLNPEEADCNDLNEIDEEE